MIFELSGNGNPLWHATKPEAKNHHRWIAEGWSWDPYRDQRKPSSHSTKVGHPREGTGQSVCCEPK